MVPLSEPKAETSLVRERALRSLGELPPFSPILSKLLASLANEEEISFVKLGDLIEKDPVMAGSLLQLVNSALHARRGSINSVRHALSLLGINKLRNAVLGMSISRMWNQMRTPPSWSMARFNMHSSAAAILSDLLAQRLNVEYAEGVFVAALLHDIGRLLFALRLSEEYERILQMHESEGKALLECEMEVAGVTHPELSAKAIKIWNLPEPIQLAARYHHDPASDPSAKGRELTLSRVLDASNQYVNSKGVSIPKKCRDCMDPTLVESLGLPEGELQSVLADFNTEYEAMSAFFR